MERKISFSLYSFLDIRFADPISAIALSPHFIIIGTMMGRITLFSIETCKCILFAEQSSENISDISFDDEFLCSIGIGDEEILRYQLMDHLLDSTSIPSCSRIKIYPSESEHNKKCLNCFTMISNGSVFQIQLSEPEEGNVTIIPVSAEFSLRELKTNKQKKGELPMTNYSVPLDFDGERFLWVEYLSDVQRNICVANVKNSANMNANINNNNNNNNNKVYKQEIQKSYGHISHCKFIENDKIFIVRDLNKCEIRVLDDNFTLVNYFTHLGDEVYAVDIYYKEKKKETIFNELGGNQERIKLNTHFQEDTELKGTHDNQMNSLQINNLPVTRGNNLETNFNKTTNLNISIGNKKEDSYAIGLLDIDGNVNVWENGKIRNEFNLYKIKEISKDHKEKLFFSLGYSYYFKFNREFFAISSDHGCYIIKKGINVKLDDN